MATDFCIPTTFQFGLRMHVKENIIEKLCITYRIANALSDRTYSCGSKEIY